MSDFDLTNSPYADQLAEAPLPETPAADEHVEQPAYAEIAPEGTPEKPEVALEEMEGYDLLVPLDVMPLGDAFRLSADFANISDGATYSEQMLAMADLVDNAGNKFIRPERLEDWKKFAVARNLSKVTDLLLAYFGEMGNE